MSKIKKKLNVIFSGIAGSFNGKHRHGIIPFSREIQRHNALSDNVDFGVLYNALTQKWFGDYINSLNDFKDNGFEGRFKETVVMSDSGGFQLTTGVIKHGTDDVKEGVYKSQATGADYGFCFDEVPVGEGGHYDHNQALEKTLQTNANIRKQIEVFKEHNSKCLIFPIAKVQPEDKEISYENLLKDCDISLIAGMGANTNMFGDFFAYPFFFKEFRDKVGFPNILHHLGVATPRRFLPFYLLACEGFFGDDFLYSIDGTSYSHSVVLRSKIAMEDGTWGAFADFTDKEFEEWKNYCQTYVPELCERFEAFKHIDPKKPLSTRDGLSCVLITSSIVYGMRMFIKIAENPLNFAVDNNILTFQQIQSIKELAKCKDWKDYYEWKGIFSGVWDKMTLNPATQQSLKPMARNNLDAFFA